MPGRATGCIYTSNANDFEPRPVRRRVLRDLVGGLVFELHALFTPRAGDRSEPSRRCYDALWDRRLAAHPGTRSTWPARGWPEGRARPRFLRGDRICVLRVHGFLACPGRARFRAAAWNHSDL